jgi:hypothetical protein
LQALAGETQGSLSMADLVGGMYYTLAARRWQAGQEPDANTAAFSDCPRVPDEQLRVLLEYCVLGCQLPYLEDEQDLQRLLHLRKYHLLFSELTSEKVSTHTHTHTRTHTHARTHTKTHTHTHTHTNTHISTHTP